MDIVNLIDLMKFVRVMRQVLLNQNQLLLLKFQRYDVLVSD